MKPSVLILCHLPRQGLVAMAFLAAAAAIRLGNTPSGGLVKKPDKKQQLLQSQLQQPPPP